MHKKVRGDFCRASRTGGGGGGESPAPSLPGCCASPGCCPRRSIAARADLGLAPLGFVTGGVGLYPVRPLVDLTSLLGGVLRAGRPLDCGLWNRDPNGQTHAMHRVQVGPRTHNPSARPKCHNSTL
jgi:hypothetical protein